MTDDTGATKARVAAATVGRGLPRRDRRGRTPVVPSVPFPASEGDPVGNDDAIIELLREIRDIQKEDIAWRRKVTEESLRTQQAAVVAQRVGLRWQRGGLIVGTLFMAGLVAYLAYFYYKDAVKRTAPPVREIPEWRPDL